MPIEALFRAGSQELAPPLRALGEWRAESHEAAETWFAEYVSPDSQERVPPLTGAGPRCVVAGGIVSETCPVRPDLRAHRRGRIERLHSRFLGHEIRSYLAAAREAQTSSASLRA